jgi:hypothetical protein
VTFPHTSDIFLVCEERTKKESRDETRTVVGSLF